MLRMTSAVRIGERGFRIADTVAPMLPGAVLSLRSSGGMELMPECLLGRSSCCHRTTALPFAIPGVVLNPTVVG